MPPQVLTRDCHACPNIPECNSSKCVAHRSISMPILRFVVASCSFFFLPLVLALNFTRRAKSLMCLENYLWAVTHQSIWSHVGLVVVSDKALVIVPKCCRVTTVFDTNIYALFSFLFFFLDLWIWKFSDPDCGLPCRQRARICCHSALEIGSRRLLKERFVSQAC